MKASSLYWNRYEVGEPFLRVITAMKTIRATETNDDEFIYSHHQLLLRNSFLLLVQLHQSGDYKRQEHRMVKILHDAKNFMMERPDMFMNQKFYSGTHPLDDENSMKSTESMRTLLKEGFDYVDSLPDTDESK